MTDARTCRSAAYASVAILALAVLSTGCAALYREKVVDAEFPLSGKRVIVIPFSRERLWYYENRDGVELGQAIRVTLKQKGDDIEIVGGHEVEAEVRGSLDDVDWTLVAKLATADYILTGNIDEMASDDNHMVGLLAGQMTVSIQVWDGKSGKRVYSRTVVARHEDSEAVDVEFKKNTRRLRAKLFSETCTEISNVLCGYVTDTYPK